MYVSARCSLYTLTTVAQVMNGAITAALPSALRADDNARQAALEALENDLVHFDCIALQCIGLNVPLHQSLMLNTSQASPSTARKRGRTSQDGNHVQDKPKRRRRLDDLV